MHIHLNFLINPFKPIVKKKENTDGHTDGRT